MNSLAFFSGGTALAGLAREFALRREKPVWLITTFDSGGSTQALRRVFDMPAVGDIRNRLLASVNPDRVSAAIVAFLRSRVPRQLAGDQAKAALFALVACDDWRACPEAAQVGADLARFFAAMPPEFDAACASIGNLALAGAWLRFGRLDKAIACYEELLAVDGRLIPISEQSLHLAAELANGEVVIGQHLLRDGLPVRRIFLTRSTPWAQGESREGSALPTQAALAAIRSAALICFPIGSFYSSLLANLLPTGVGRAIAESNARKVLIPNTGVDPERGNLPLGAQVDRLLAVLRADAPDAPLTSLLDTVLIDSANGIYPGNSAGAAGPPDWGLPVALNILDRQLVRDGRHDPIILRSLLLDLACGRL